MSLFHVMVAKNDGPPPKLERLDVAWVRWYDLDHSYDYGFEDKRLPQFTMAPTLAWNAFGFIDPSIIARRAHMLPGFAHGSVTGDSVGLAIGHGNAEKEYKYYYAGMWVISG